jgi:hypothetical protein
LFRNVFTPCNESLYHSPIDYIEVHNMRVRTLVLGNWSSGTDGLDKQSAVGIVTKWLCGWREHIRDGPAVPTHVFAEGERLIDLGLLQALRQAGWAVHVIHLDMSEEVAEASRALRNTRFDRSTKCVARVIDNLRRFLSEADDFMSLILVKHLDDVTVNAFKGLIHDVTYAYLQEEVYEEDDASVVHHEAAVDEEGIVHEDAETDPGASDDEWLARAGDKAVDVQKPHGDEAAVRQTIPCGRPSDWDVSRDGPWNVEVPMHPGYWPFGWNCWLCNVVDDRRMKRSEEAAAREENAGEVAGVEQADVCVCLRRRWTRK